MSSQELQALVERYGQDVADALNVLAHIYRADASGNNGAYMGEAILCPAFARAAADALTRLGLLP